MATQGASYTSHTDISNTQVTSHKLHIYSCIIILKFQIFIIWESVNCLMLCTSSWSTHMMSPFLFVASFLVFLPHGCHRVAVSVLQLALQFVEFRPLPWRLLSHTFLLLLYLGIEPATLLLVRLLLLLQLLLITEIFKPTNQILYRIQLTNWKLFLKWPNQFIPISYTLKRLQDDM